jgi:V/A-type H+-transporting ATPase subunit K
MDYNMIGPVLAMGLSAIGSSIGCGIAGMTSHAVMSRVEEGHGMFIGMSAAPSSQTIYGFILMLFMKNAINAGTITALSGVGIGLVAGIAIMLSAIYQGRAASSAIQAAAKQPAIAGKCWAALGMIESFALFAFVFSLILLQ